MISPTYQVGKADNACSRCGSAFAEGEHCISALEEDAGGGLTRADFCRRCWNPSHASYFSFWRSRCRPDTQSSKADDDALLAFYGSLSGKEGRRAHEMIYILSLYLLRKKKLLLHDIEEDDDGETLVLSGPGEGQSRRIRNPGLSADRIVELNESIGSLFETHR